MDVEEQDIQLDYGSEPPAVTVQAQARTQTSPTSNSKSNYLHTSSSLPPKPTFDGSAIAKQHGHGRSASASASTSASAASAYTPWSSLNPSSAPKGVASLPEKPLVSYGETSSAVQLPPPARRASLSPHPLQPQNAVASPTQALHTLMRLPAVESDSIDGMKTVEIPEVTPPTSVDKASNAEKTSDKGKGRAQEQEQEPEPPRERERNNDSRQSKPIRRETRDRSSSAVPPNSSRRDTHTGATGDNIRERERRSTVESGSGSAAQRILDELLVDMISIIEQDEDEEDDGDDDAFNGESDSYTSDASRISSKRYTPPPRTQSNVPTGEGVIGVNSDIEEGEVETDSVVERRRVRREKDQLLKEELKAEKEKKRKRRVENHISEKDVYAYLRHRGFSTALQDSFKVECSTKSGTLESPTGPSKSPAREAKLPDVEKIASYRFSSKNSLSKLLDKAEQAEEARKAVFKLLNACTSIVQKEKLDDEEKERRYRSRQRSREREKERERERERERGNDRERMNDRRGSQYQYEDDRHSDYRRRDRDRESGKGSYTGRDREGDRRRDRRFSWDASDDYPTRTDRNRGDRDRRAISAMPGSHEDDVRAATGIEARAGISDRLQSIRTVDNRLPTPTSPEPPSANRNQKIIATKGTSKTNPSSPAPESNEVAMSTTMPTRESEKDISRNRDRNSTTVERNPAEKERAEKAAALAAKFRQALESKHLVFSKHDIETLKPTGVPEHLRPHRPISSTMNIDGSNGRSPSFMEIMPTASSATGVSGKATAYYSSQPVRVNGSGYGAAFKPAASSSTQGTSSTSKTAASKSTSQSGSFMPLSSVQKADSIYELVPDYLKRQREQKARENAAAANQDTPSTEEANTLAAQSEAQDATMQIDDAQPDTLPSLERTSLKLQLPHKTTSTIDKGKGRDTSDTVQSTSTQKGGVSQWFGGSVEPDLPPLDNNDGPDAPVTTTQDMYQDSATSGIGNDRSPPPFDSAGSPSAGSPPPIGAHKFAQPRTGAESIKSMFPGRKTSTLPRKSVPYNDVLSSNDPVAIPQRQTTHIDPRRVAAAAARAKAGSGSASGSGNGLSAGRAESAEAMAMAVSASPTAMSPIDKVMEASASPPLPPPLRASVGEPSSTVSPSLSSNVRGKQIATIAPTSARDSPAKQVASASPAVNDTLPTPQQPGQTGTEVSTNAAPEVDKQTAVATGMSDSQKLENDLKSKLQRKRQRDEVAATAKKSNKRVARAPAATASATPPLDSAHTEQQRTAASPPPIVSNTSGSTSTSKQTSTNTPTSIRKLINSQGKRPAEVYARNHAVDTDEDEPESIQVSAKLSISADPSVARKTTPIVEVPRSRQSSVASSARAGSVETRVQAPPQPTVTAKSTDLTQARKKGTVARKTTGGKKAAPIHTSIPMTSVEAPTSTKSGIKLKLKISSKGEKEKETKQGSSTARPDTISKADTSQVIEIDDSSDDDEPLRGPTNNRNNTTTVTKPSSAGRPRARPIVGSGKRLSDVDGRLVVEEDPSTDASSSGNASASKTEALHRASHELKDGTSKQTLLDYSAEDANVPPGESGGQQTSSTMAPSDNPGQAISQSSATAPTVAPPRHSSSPSPAFATRLDGDESGSESYSPSRMPRYSPSPIPEDAAQFPDVPEAQVLQQVTVEETVQISVTAASTIASDPPMDGTNNSPLDLRMTQIASSQSPETQMLHSGSDIAFDFDEDVDMLPDESYSQAIASQILSEVMDLPDEPQVTLESTATSSKASAMAPRAAIGISPSHFTQSAMAYSSDQRQNMDPMDLSQVFGSDEEDAEGSSVSDKTEAKEHVAPLNTFNQISAETSSAREASDVSRGNAMAAGSTTSVEIPPAEMTANEESQDTVTAFVNEALSGVMSAKHLGKERLEEPLNGDERSSHQIGNTSESTNEATMKGARPVAMDFMQTASVSFPASSATTVTANASSHDVLAQGLSDSNPTSLNVDSTKSGAVDSGDRTPILSRAVPPGLAKAGISGQSRASLHEASPVGTFSEADSIEIIMRGQSPPKQFNLPNRNNVNGSSNVDSVTVNNNVRKAVDSLTQASLDKLDKPLEDDTFVRCRYSTGCLDLNCKFAHPSPAFPVWQAKSMNAADITKSKDICVDGVHCRVTTCSFSHPSPALRRLEPCPDRQNCPHGAKCVFSHRDHTRHSSGSGAMYSRNQSARFGSNTSLASAATSSSPMQMQQLYRSSSPAFVHASSSSPAPAPALASSQGNASASAPASSSIVNGGVSGFLSHHPMPPMPAGTPPLSRSSSPAVPPGPNAMNNAAAAAATSSSSSPAPQASQAQSQNRTWTNQLNTATANPMSWLANLTGFSKHS